MALRPAPLRSLAADADLTPLWQAIHDRLSTGTGTDPAGIATVPAPTLGTVAALRSWLDTPVQRRQGRTSVPHTPTGLKVPLAPLLKALGVPEDELQPLVERAVGRDVVNRKERRLTTVQLRQDLKDYTAARLPHLPRLRARLAVGVDEDTASDIRRLTDALASLTRQLPHRPPRTLAKLAHDHAGDPHYYAAIWCRYCARRPPQSVLSRRRTLGFWPLLCPCAPQSRAADIFARICHAGAVRLASRYLSPGPEADRQAARSTSRSAGTCFRLRGRRRQLATTRNSWGGRCRTRSGWRCSGRPYGRLPALPWSLTRARRCAP